jgi:alcohol dehydrogenase
LLQVAGQADGSGTAGERLAARLEALALAGELPRTLRDLGASRGDLPALAASAAREWTGTFNPRPFDEAAALSLYDRAY